MLAEVAGLAAQRVDEVVRVVAQAEPAVGEAQRASEARMRETMGKLTGGLAGLVIAWILCKVVRLILKVARFDRRCRHTYLNRYGESVYGLPREKVIGRTNAELGLPPELVDLTRREFTAVFETGHWLRNVLSGVGYSVAIYTLFVRFLEVLLPVGLLGW